MTAIQMMSRIITPYSFWEILRFFNTPITAPSLASKSSSIFVDDWLIPLLFPISCPDKRLFRQHRLAPLAEARKVELGKSTPASSLSR
jgi:hypothetical protein